MRPQPHSPHSAGAEVLVTGWGISGRAVVGPLHDLGARVTVTDARPASRDEVTALGHEFATEAELGALERFALVVTSPGFRPESPILVAAAGAGIPVWGDIEFTWRVDQAERYGPIRRWLVVTGTNGKTTTTSMLASVLSAAEVGAIACGNIGLPVLDALRHPEVRGARGRTLVVPAVLGAVGAPGRRGRAQHRRGSSRLARRDGRLRRGEAARARRRRRRRRSRRSGRRGTAAHRRVPSRPARARRTRRRRRHPGRPRVRRPRHSRRHSARSPASARPARRVCSTRWPPRRSPARSA